MYTVTISDDGTFAAEYVVPPALSVPLGSSGSAVDVVRNEDGTYSANGEVITAETMVTAANGNVYRAVLSPEGIPVGVMHVAAMQDVMLGDLGGSVTLTQAEDMSWWYGETAVASGYVHTAANGNMYALTLDAEGMWSAMYQQVEVTVDLGTQGPVTLVRAEDMSWWLGSDAVDVGSEVMSPSGNTYTLWYTDGVWSARFEPESMMIEGTGLVAMTKEDRSGYDVDGADLPASGEGDIDTSMGTYRVTMMDGMLMGTRLDKVAIDGNTDDWNTVGMRNGKAAGGNPNVSILPDEDDTENVNEAATALVIDGEEHPFSALLGSGMSQVTGKNFVAEAKEDLEGIRDQIAAILDALDGSLHDAQVARLWGTSTSTDPGTGNRDTNVNGVLRGVFGGEANAEISSPPAADEALDEIGKLITALSSVDGLAAALDDDGVLDGHNGGKTAAQIFDAVESETTVSYGVLGETRFGAVSKKERTDAVSDLTYSHDDDRDELGVQDTADGGVLGGFSFGVTGETDRARHVMSAGNAYYEGTTLAVDQGGTHYSGDISVRVRFVTSQVDGLITNLRSAEGDPWVYLFDNVETIVLPRVRMNPNGTWNEGTGEATASFALRAGSPGGQELASTFSGRLLGTGDNAGYQTVGTWSVSSDDPNTAPDPDASYYLAGGFGAERVADEPDRRPAVDDGTGIEAEVSGTMTTLEDGMLKIKVAKYGWTRTGELGADGSSYEWAQQDNTNDTTSATDATRTYEVDLGNLVGKEGVEANYNGPKYMDIARELIETERTKLAVLIETDQLGGPREAQELIWQRVQEILLTYVFQADRVVFDAGSDGSQFYDRLPQGVRGRYDPDDPDATLETVDRILLALSSSDNLEAALDPDEDALFVNTAANPNTGLGRSASDVWAEKDSQVKAWFGKTDYTRFGTWRVRRSYNAQRTTASHDGAAHPDARHWQDAEIDAFAYSPLTQSKITRTSSPNYPAGAIANYVGQTVAFARASANGGNSAPQVGYVGEVNVRVAWNPLQDADDNALPVGGTVQTVISNLQNSNGDTYDNGGAVRELVFPTVAVTVTDDGALGIAADSGGAITIVREDRTTDTTALTLDSHIGTFVGASSDGPLGIMGTYSTGSAVGDLTGAYGADLP